MKELLEQGTGILLIGIMMGGCVLIRLILFGYYGRLSKACKSMGETRNKTITYIKEDLKDRSGRNGRPKNALIYTECRLAECKVGGIYVGTLECIWQQSLLLVPLCGVMTTFAGILYGCGHRMILTPLFLGGGGFFALMALDLLGGLREKHKRIRLSIRDYIENIWEGQDGQAEVIWEPVQNEKKKEKKVRQTKIKEKKDKLLRCRSRKKGKAQEEKRRLTEELLRERRQLEARSLAESRRREMKENQVCEQMIGGNFTAEVKMNEAAMEEVTTAESIMAEAAAAEIAVPEVSETPGSSIVPATAESEINAPKAEFAEETDDSYEALLSEVLAEYLA